MQKVRENVQKFRNATSILTRKPQPDEYVIANGLMQAYQFGIINDRNLKIVLNKAPHSLGLSEERLSTRLQELKAADASVQKTNGVIETLKRWLSWA